MPEITRFGAAMGDELLKKSDCLIREKDWYNRFEAIRDLLRDNLIEQDWELGKTQEIAGTVAIVYSHAVHELTNRLTERKSPMHSFLLKA
jgi:CopG family nickel-responsive transcriptional regulator